MIEKWIRENIKQLSPYSSAREEFTGNAHIWLDANENPYSNGFNRYPDPMQRQIKKSLASLKGIEPENIFVGNGSDEALDLIVRIFCEPKQDRIIYCSPTYAMYQVVADINQVEAVDIPLQPDLSLPVASILDTAAKILFICSPNNPTGQQFKKEDVLTLINKFDGIVVVDEAYVDFANYSLLQEIKNHENLIVCQTLSKSWGLAGLRVGLAFAQKPIIEVMNKVKMPYNVNSYSQEKALEFLTDDQPVYEKIKTIKKEKEKMEIALRNMSFVEKIFPSDANFLLVKFKQDVIPIYNALIDHKGILVRNQSNKLYCENTLRFTIGTEKENEILISSLKELST